MVVHARRDVEGSSTRGNDTVTASISISTYDKGANDVNHQLTCRISNIAIVLSSLKVTEWSGTSRRIRHDPQPSVHLSFLPQLAKHPPNTLHKGRLQGLVARLKVDPPSHPFNGMLPLAGVSHDNLSTRCVVLVNTHLHHVGFALDVESFVDLVFDG